MKVLLDECLPKKLKQHLLDFDVQTVTEMKWNSVKNGKLMKLAVEMDLIYSSQLIKTCHTSKICKLIS